MTTARSELIGALRRTAQRLSGDVSYQWGHMGMCNCGHLAQSITGLAGAEIHQSALVREGDWEQQAKDYCPTSGNLIDAVLAAMFELGLTRDDIRHLEKLSDPAVIRRVGRHLRFNNREDVELYVRAWADMLEELSLPLQHQPRAESDHHRPGDAIDRAVSGGVQSLDDHPGKYGSNRAVPQDGVGKHDPHRSHLDGDRSLRAEEEREDAAEVHH